MNHDSQFFNCIPRTQQAKLQRQYPHAYVVGQFHGRPADSQASFLASMRHVPMDPPVRPNATYDAVIDSCFGGLVALAASSVALIWPNADSTKHSVLQFGITLLHSLARDTTSAEPHGLDLKLFLVCANPNTAALLERSLGQDPSLGAIWPRPGDGLPNAQQHLDNGVASTVAVCGLHEVVRWCPAGVG